MSDFSAIYRVTRNVMAASDMDWHAALDLSPAEVRAVMAEEKLRRAAMKRGRRR